MARDTTDAARDAQLAAWRRLGPSGRALMAAEMSDAALRTAVAAEMRRHPRLTEREATHAVRRRTWGVELADLVFAARDR